METSRNKRNYSRFRKFLIKNGYSMMQYSVYSKIILNRTVLHFQKGLLRKNAPPDGYVETLIVTEKQFSNMESIVGEGKRNNQEQSTKRMIIL